MRKTIDVKLALELRNDHHMAWSAVAKELSRRCGRHPPFHAESVKNAVTKWLEYRRSKPHDHL